MYNDDSIEKLKLNFELAPPVKILGPQSEGRGPHGTVYQLRERGILRGKPLGPQSRARRGTRTASFAY